MLSNSDLGCSIYLKPSASYTFGVFGINTNMSMDEANEILYSEGAVPTSLAYDVAPDNTWPDMVTAMRYLKDDVYFIAVFEDGDGIDIIVTPNYDYVDLHYDESFR